MLLDTELYAGVGANNGLGQSLYYQISFNNDTAVGAKGQQWFYGFYVEDIPASGKLKLTGTEPNSLYALGNKYTTQVSGVLSNNLAF